MQDAVLHLNLPTNEAAGAPGAALPSFIVGPENRLLAPVIQRLLDGQDLAAAATLFNPLVLVGPSGSGKSHLVHGLVRHWRRRLDETKVAYFTATDLGREYQSAHADERLPAWRSELRHLQILVVEGLERLRRGAAVARELRQAIDAVIELGGMVVVTADREPSTLTNLDSPLRDRLAAGLSIRLTGPDLDARRAILVQAARARGVALSDEQLDSLARPESAVAGLLLQQLDDQASGKQHDELAAARFDAPAELCPMKQILAVAARYFGVSQAALAGPSRRKSLVAARNTVVYLARRLTPLSYAQIGRSLGGRDHTTIMHAQHRLAEALTHDPETQRSVEQLERILRC
jgi:chromosomal replication initiator protein